MSKEDYDTKERKKTKQQQQKEELTLAATGKTSLRKWNKKKKIENKILGAPIIEDCDNINWIFNLKEITLRLCEWVSEWVCVRAHF